MPDRLTCYDCGGNGIDVGSLNEPEACKVCLGAGELFVEFDPRSSQYGQHSHFCESDCRKGSSSMSSEENRSLLK